jgi:hypothetical protein
MGNTEFSNLSAYIPEEVVGLFHMRKLKGLARLKHDVIPSSFVTKGSSQKGRARMNKIFTAFGCCMLLGFTPAFVSSSNPSSLTTEYRSPPPIRLTISNECTSACNSCQTNCGANIDCRSQCEDLAAACCSRKNLGYAGVCHCKDN